MDGRHELGFDEIAVGAGGDWRCGLFRHHLAARDARQFHDERTGVLSRFHAGRAGHPAARCAAILWLCRLAQLEIEKGQ